MSGKKGMNHYPVETKLEAVRLYFEEGKTQREITQILGLRSDGRVETWVRQYRGEGTQAFMKPVGRPHKQAESEQMELAQLRMENALLKKYHTELRTKVLAKRNIGSSITIARNTK